MCESTRINLRQQLRSATTESHAKLDGVMDRHPPFASADNYRRYLSGMDRLYQHCDASVCWVESHTDLTTHSPPLRDLIRQDIASLGLANSVEMPISAENTTSVGLLTSDRPAVHWGRTYVIEGSSMGATFLVKQAEKELPENFGKTFLRQLASDAKNRWSVFAAELAIADADSDEAVAAAIGVFDYAYQIFGE